MTDEAVARPPLGIMPRHLWAEAAEHENPEVVRARLLDVLAAATRYVTARRFIPLSWILEIAEHHNNAGAVPGLEVDDHATKQDP
jgi:hypothetical protein